MISYVITAAILSIISTIYIFLMRIKKKLDIILSGPPASGKTTFLKFFTNQKFNGEYKPTDWEEELPIGDNETIKMITKQYGKKIKFRKLIDLPGDSSWLDKILEKITKKNEKILKKIIEAIKQKDKNTIIWFLYFVALPMIIEEDYPEIDKKRRDTIELFKLYSDKKQYKYIKIVESDLGYIRNIIEQYEGVHLLIVFNFADLYPTYLQNKNLFEQKIETHVDNWLAIAGGKSRVEYVVGSLENTNEALNLIKKTLQRIKEKTK